MEARRTTIELTPEQQAHLEQARREIEQELPELIERGQKLKDAGEEPTLSGELRRAVHASELSLVRIAEQIGVSPVQLDEFLTGEAPLPSDAMDRLAALLGYELTRTR